MNMLNTAPLISIITPTYNRFGLLIRAMKSVQNQTWSDWEMIIIDDCSSEKCSAEIQALLDSDDRFNYHRLEVNGGISHARNTGIGFARGSFITCLDDDDEFLPNRLKEQVAALQAKTEFKIVICGSYHIDVETGQKRIVLPPKIDNFYHALLTTLIVEPMSFMVRREVLTEVGLFDETFPYAEDWDLLLRIAQRYPQFIVLRKPLYNFYDRHWHRCYSLNEIEETEKLHFKIMKKHWFEYKKNRKILSERIRFDGTRYCMTGYLKQGRRRFLKSLVINPLNLKTYSCLLISLFGSRVYKFIAILKATLLHGK